jgi:hypothetical protein
MQCEQSEWQHSPIESGQPDDDDATDHTLVQPGHINTVRITINPITSYFAVEANGNKVHLDDMGFEAGTEVVLAIHWPGDMLPNVRDEPHKDELCTELRVDARANVAKHQQLRVEAVEAMQVAVAAQAAEKLKAEQNEELEKQAELDIIKLEEKKLKKAVDRTEAERAAYEKLKEGAKLKVKEQEGEERQQLKRIAEEDRLMQLWKTWAMPCNAVELKPALEHAVSLPYSSVLATGQDRHALRQ